MPYVLKISPQAHNDIVDIYNYILKDGESIAKKQASAIYDGLNNLSEFPNIGKDLNKYVEPATDYKYIVIDKIYLAFYRIKNGAVEVIRILRGEQDYLRLLGLK